MKFSDLLRLPETKTILSLNDVSTTLLHAKIIKNKVFLKRIYTDFYQYFNNLVSSNTGERCLVELGSGGGFIKEIISDVITSDIIALPNIDRQFSALKMPFEKNTVDAFLMINVLHHVDDSMSFFKEVDRCLKIGGKIIMVEPANTLFGRFIYKNFHHELFDPSGDWGFESGGPLSSANGAIPWIIFYRDRQKFEKEFPNLKIKQLVSHTPFRYLISGGISMRQLLPSFMYNFVKIFESILTPLNNYLGMFVSIEIEKVA